MHKKSCVTGLFLAEAIEGYNKADLTKAKKKKTKLGVFNNKIRWFSVTALIIIIAGVTALSMHLLKNSNNKQELVQIKDERISNTALKDSIINKNVLQRQPDTAKLTAKNEILLKPSSFTASKLKKQNKIKLLAGESKDTSAVASIAPAALQQNKDEPNTLITSLNKTQDSIPKVAAKRISGINIAPTIFAGKVVDETNQPVANAVVESTDKTETVITDKNGNFRLFKSDTILNATASNIGFSTKTTQLKPGNNNVITLEQNNTDLNDVVVVGRDVVKKNKTDNSNPQPVGGWQNFNNYVVKQLNNDSAKENFLNQDKLAEIEFLIDNDGSPYNFKILKPLDDEKNAKAIDILKSGPKWNASINKKAKVIIHFN